MLGATIRALTCVLALSSATRAALPASGSTYHIVNPATGLFVDDFGSVTTPGNSIISFPLTGGANQIWKATLLASGGTTSDGVYTFSCSLPGAVISIYAVGTTGNGLTAQNFGIPLNVTVVPGTNATTITVPTTNIAVTTAATSANQLTLQALSASNLHQRWRLDLVP